MRQQKPSKKSRSGGIASKLQARYDMILGILEPRAMESTGTSELLDQLDYGSGSRSTRLRRLHRDLDVLESNGQVRRQENGWIWSDESKEDALAERAKAAALKFLLETFEMAIPQDIHEQLKRSLANAKKKLRELREEDPRIRWMSALRVAPSHHPLTDPILNMKVVDEIEASILKRTQVQLTWRRSGFGRDDALREGVGSISHYLLELPGRPSIEFWPEVAERPIRIQVEDIEEIRATVRERKSVWPERHEPNLVPRYITIESGRVTEDGSKVVLRTDAKRLRKLEKMKISRQPEWLVKAEGNDKFTVSFRANVDLQLYWALNAMDDVVILRPTFLAKLATLDARAKYEKYKDVCDSGEVMRMHETEVRETFTEDDRHRLEKSGIWQEQPKLVEELCHVLAEADPGGAWSGSNPHALTEYLLEVEMLIRRLPEVAGDTDLARILSSIFHEMFNGHISFRDWEGLSQAVRTVVERAGGRMPDSRH